MSLDCDADRGLQWVVSWASGIVLVGVGAVSAPTAFHVLYLLEAPTEMQGCGSKCAGCFHNEWNELVFGPVEVLVFGLLRFFPMFGRFSGTARQQVWVVCRGQRVGN